MPGLQPPSAASAPRPGWLERFRRHHSDAQVARRLDRQFDRHVDGRFEEEADRLRLLTVLSDARVLVEESWVRGAWFAIRNGDGGTRFVRGGAPLQLADDRIVGSCIVGSIIRAGGANGIHEPPVQRALAVVWHALHEDESAPVRWNPPPLVRHQQVRDLTRWNDRLAEGPEQVAELLLTAERVALTSA